MYRYKNYNRIMICCCTLYYLVGGGSLVSTTFTNGFSPTTRTFGNININNKVLQQRRRTKISAKHNRRNNNIIRKQQQHEQSTRLKQYQNDNKNDETNKNDMVAIPMGDIMMMSSSPDMVRNPEEDEFFKKIQLPPKPEDIFTMIGDLLSISIYGFFDHFVCYDLMNLSVTKANTISKLSILLAKVSPAASTAISPEYLLSTPVWVDCTSFSSNHLSNILQITVRDQIVTNYSPLLQPTGLAVVALSSCWLLSGWIHEAFSFQNTLSCRTDKVLLVTVQSWMTCSLLLFTLTALSHYICGCENMSSFTKGDIGYIVDSLSVLVIWRFLASYMLGYSNGNDE